MEAHKVVPDVIDEAPPKAVSVVYENGAKVNFGNELTPTEVKSKPSVKWEAQQNVYHAIVMVDPDAPSREDPKLGPVNHWLVVNIVGNDVSTGDEIAAYVSSGPPEGSGLHRYVFLVYQQPKKLEVDEPRSSATSVKSRFRFNLQKFAEKYGLGKAIAGNFYQAQWDPFVDELMQSLTD